MPKKFNFNQAIEELEQINNWFQDENIDLEEALSKLKKGQQLIKQCQKNLKKVENEFKEVEKDF